jgi:hypothetical protein
MTLNPWGWGVPATLFEFRELLSHSKHLGVALQPLGVVRRSPLLIFCFHSIFIKNIVFFKKKLLGYFYLIKKNVMVIFVYLLALDDIDNFLQLNRTLTIEW